VCILLLVSGFYFLSAEIIHVSKLEEKKPPYFLKKDIFYPIRSLSKEERATLQNQFSGGEIKQDQEQENSKKEIQRSISFEGYVEKNNSIHALINLNGEYFVVGQGEIFMETIKIVKIEKNQIFLEVESQPIVIQLKGDGDD
jgi:hypothetical protein